MTWVLLVFIGLSGVQPSGSQLAVPGFTAKETCLTAGAAYFDAVRSADTTGKVIALRWVCVAQ